MQRKVSLKLSALIISITIIIFSGMVTLFLIPNLPSYTEPIPIPPTVAEVLENRKNQDLNSGLPIRLKIPKINVDAAFQYVGLTLDGAMDIPKGPDDVAWFTLGPIPGKKGSAVIAGHFGWKNGIPAVFDHLYALKEGDKIYVESNTGVTVTFVVRKVGTYGENSDATEVFASNDGKAHLNLITCEGVWNKAAKSYSNRLIVFTDRVD